MKQTQRAHGSIGRFQQTLQGIGQAGAPLQMRLLGFFLLFLISIMLLTLIILLLTGVFSTGFSEQVTLFNNELAHATQSVSRDFGALSLQTVRLGEALAATIEDTLLQNNAQPAALSQRADLLEPVLDSLLPPMQSAIARVKSSGVFVILDASVYDDMPQRRAGLHLKNLEPNIVSGAAPYLHLQRGPAALSRKHDIRLQSQWEQEFDVTGADYFYTPLSTARAQAGLPLSRLYYWASRTVFAGTTDDVMLCCAPLIASDGSVMGVCGFEMSAMLFRLSYVLETQENPGLFQMLAPLQNGCLDASAALFAGSRAQFASLMEQTAEIRQDGQLYTYTMADGAVYEGLHQAVTLYPEGGAYAQEQWAIALMQPSAEFWSGIREGRDRLLLLLLLLLLVSAACAVYLSRRYTHPLVQALAQIKSGSLAQVERTRIPEIDDLLEYLSMQDSAPTPGQAAEAQPQSSLYEAFVRNIDTLSVAERAVFDLYMEGHTAKEIAEILYLSINTIKTHNRRIYTKLNVTSRKELMVYVGMMKEAERTQGGKAPELEEPL